MDEEKMAGLKKDSKEFTEWVKKSKDPCPNKEMLSMFEGSNAEKLQEIIREREQYIKQATFIKLILSSVLRFLKDKSITLLQQNSGEFIVSNGSVRQFCRKQ